MANRHPKDDHGWAEAGSARLREILNEVAPDIDADRVGETVDDAGLVIIPAIEFDELLDKAAAFDRMYRIVHPDT